MYYQNTLSNIMCFILSKRVSFDFNKYSDNLDIIYHVRNAISHGNIKIVEYGKEPLDTVIHIIDRKNGRTGDIVYDKQLSIREFLGIFRENNLKILCKFYENALKKIESIDRIKRK